MDKQYSSFAQTKGLLWHENFDSILSGSFKPPIGAVVDLTDRCNLSCVHCNSQAYRSANILEKEHVKQVLEDLGNWGVKSVCFAGGGEPSLHPDFAEIIKYSIACGLQVGISTNGTALNQDTMETIAKHATFCGISVDAGTEKTWAATKKSNLWRVLIANAKYICDLARNTKLDLTYKFMLTPYNQYELLKACKLAKKLGFKNFFVRPASFENVPGLKETYQYQIDKIEKQLHKCFNLETDDFHVYSSFKRVDANLRKIAPFKKCLITPLIATFCADGYCYLCIDYRERSYGRLCKHLELRTFWGSAAHKKIIDEINLNNCPRCAFAHYNMQIEAYASDYMFRWFP
jgi:MoaA/NifB/PqqE/SkfB family radical SAM enzyme